MPLGLGSIVNGIWRFGESDSTGPLFSDFLNLLGDTVRTMIGDSGWADLTPAAGWTAGTGANKPQVRRIGKTVWMRGGFTAGTAGTTCAVVGAGYRPATTAQFPAYSTANNLGLMVVFASGIIQPSLSTVSGNHSACWLVD